MEIQQLGLIDALIREFKSSGSINGFKKFDPKSISSIRKQNLENGSESEYPNSDPELAIDPTGPNPSNSVESPGSGTSSGSDSLSDPIEAGLKYITQMLMEEEDLEYKPCMLLDCLALQATEKSLYDVIGKKYSPKFDESQQCLLLNRDSDSPNSVLTSSSSHSSDSLIPVDRFVESDLIVNGDKIKSFYPQPSLGGKRNHYVEDSDYVENGRINKQLASNYIEETDEQTELYDEVLLCPNINPHLQLTPCDDLANNGTKTQPKKSNGGRPRKNQVNNKKEVIDLSNLLTQCAQAVASNDKRTANELLIRIRQHSSPQGDGTERLSHFLANALEQRLLGHGTGAFASFTTRGISAAAVLKGYQVYIQACPFKKLSNFYANRSILRLSRGSKRLHIIDFGILYGFQWPCLIQLLSLTPDGPPKLRITGIDFPQPGLRPAERVESTGRRLKNYCDRFNVPFEYTAIAKKWDSIKLEDIKIEKDEVLVVNCLFRLRNVPDDTVVVSNPRDAVLNLINRINPDLFVHGVVNGTYNAPFFLTRFRETFFHYSALFDMFDSTVPREDKNRMLYEREVFGKDAMNVISCEGTERVERPETYKQWQARNSRAGFRQVSLDKEIVGEVRDRVRRGYHRDFVVNEDGKWMLQGWKGRIACGISCWKPVR